MRTLLGVLLVSSSVSMAAPTIYQEHNFSIEFPDGWQKAEASPEVLVLVRSPDGAKGVAVIASKFAAQESSSALEKMVRGSKNQAAKQGIAITGEQDLDINGVPFHIHSFTLPTKVAVVSNMAVAHNRGYAVQAFSSNSDPAADPEIQGMIQSFRLLSPVAANAAPLKEAVLEGDAFKAGELTAKVLFVAFAVGVIVLLVQKLGRRKKTSA